ncbi:MAG: phosphoribosyltransferase [Acidobacteria bacterium]|nr:phosphoribosyltransferase [Acidobacteriota bacterium]
MMFADRADAGRILASKLTAYKGRPDVVIFALPRGGIPVAYEIGKAIGAPIDVFVVRKLGVPGQEELAMGAIATGDIRIINYEVVNQLGITQEAIDAVTDQQREELRRREQLYRGGRPQREVRGQSVILVDDGIATGSTMRAAIAALRQLGPARIVVAVPVAAPETCQQIGGEVDEIICAATPEPLFSIGQWYKRFEQTTDDEVRDLLGRAA